MTPLGIIPGPKASRDILSFLATLLEEFQALEQGLWMKRENSEAELVRAYLLFVGGDLPALQNV